LVVSCSNLAIRKTYEQLVWLVIDPGKVCTRAVSSTRLHGHISELSCYMCWQSKQDPPFSQFWLLSAGTFATGANNSHILTGLSYCLQAGVAASRSLEEVAELEKAICLLIQRAADIYDAKSAQLDTDMAATLAKLQPGSSDGSSLAASLNRDHSMGEAERAVHAEASTSNVGDESADGGKTAVSATSELITPEVEKQLPRSARRV